MITFVMPIWKEVKMDLVKGLKQRPDKLVNHTLGSHIKSFSTQLEFWDGYDRCVERIFIRVVAK